MNNLLTAQIMSASQAFICKHCISNINCHASEYVATVESKHYTFCYLNTSVQLLDGSAENIRRLTKLLEDIEADSFYENMLFD
jgi:hypothetical protein